jgi:hypothetical protein
VFCVSAQQIEILEAVSIRSKTLLAPVATRNHNVKGAIKFYPQRACDDSFILPPTAIIRILASTPYK